MSSITLIRVRLKGVNAEILRQVVKQLCQEYGGAMATTIKDYYGNETAVELGFTCPQFQRGVGFVVEKGQVSMKGDFYGQYEFQRQLEKQLLQTYTAQAHVQARHE